MKTVTYALNMSQVTGGTTETTTERSSGGRRLHNMFGKTVYELIQELSQYDADDSVEIVCTLDNAIVGIYDEDDRYECIASCEKTDDRFEIGERKERGRTIVQLQAFFEN